MEKSHWLHKAGFSAVGYEEGLHTGEKGEWGREVPAEEEDIAIWDIEPMWGEAGIQMGVEQIGPCRGWGPEQVQSLLCCGMIWQRVLECGQKMESSPQVGGSWC